MWRLKIFPSEYMFNPVLCRLCTKLKGQIFVFRQSNVIMGVGSHTLKAKAIMATAEIHIFVNLIKEEKWKAYFNLPSCCFLNLNYPLSLIYLADGRNMSIIESLVIRVTCVAKRDIKVEKISEIIGHLSSPILHLQYNQNQKLSSSINAST